MSGTGRIALKYHVAHAGVPDPGQVIGPLACDHHKPFGLSIQIYKVLGLVAIDDYHSVQSEVRPLYNVDAMCSVAR